MKYTVKYIILVILLYLGWYHKQPESSEILDCGYFASEYILITLSFMYLAVLKQGRDRAFYGILSGYFALKMIYNVLIYQSEIMAKMVDLRAEYWGYIFTGIIVVSLLLIQISYVVIKER